MVRGATLESIWKNMEGILSTPVQKDAVQPMVISNYQS